MDSALPLVCATIAGCLSGDILVCSMIRVLYRHASGKIVGNLPVDQLAVALLRAHGLSDEDSP